MFEFVEFSSDRARIDVSRGSALMRCCISLFRITKCLALYNTSIFLHACLYLPCLNTYFQYKSLGIVLIA